MTFTTATIPDEYLVHFKHYLLPSTRQRYIRAGLGDEFEVLPRTKFRDIASDFEVIRFNGDLSPLGDHPEVKYIGHHKSVRRLFSVINSTDSEESEAQNAKINPFAPENDKNNVSPKTTKKKTKTSKSYHSPEVFMNLVGEAHQTRKLLRVINTKQVTRVLRADTLWDIGECENSGSSGNRPLG